MRAVRLASGGGWVTESSGTSADSAGTTTETDAIGTAGNGDKWPPALHGRSWLPPGTVFLQQSSDLAVGAQLPLRQQSAASRFRIPLAKQSKGRINSTMARRATRIWMLRFTPGSKDTPIRGRPPLERVRLHIHSVENVLFAKTHLEPPVNPARSAELNLT